MPSRKNHLVVMSGMLLTLALAACGGGSASDVVAFAEDVGVSNTPPSPSPSPTPTGTRVVWTNAHWVDFQRGDDNNAGDTKGSAWKHAPGDPNATGIAASYRPQAGDQIVFAAGSRYYGSITAQFQGTSIAPIKLVGESTAIPAVIDGSSEIAAVRPCPSASACGGIAAWRQASIAVFDAPLPSEAALFAEGELLTPAQWRDPTDLFYADEISEMSDVDGGSIAAGAIALPAELSTTVTSPAGLSIAMWVQPNVVVERAATGVSQGKVLFDPTGLQPYTDRAGKFALRGLPSFVSTIGEFAILPDRRTVVFISNGAATTVSAATGRSGIDLSGAKDVVVENLSFENFSTIDGNIRSGLPVWALRSPASNLIIQNNRFKNLFMKNGQGAIIVQQTDGLKILGNTIRTVSKGSGMRLINNDHVLIERNSVERIGRTGIYLANNTDSLILRNRVRDVKGVHGNGISIYLGNNRTKVIANTVTESPRPMTIRGNGNSDPAFVDALFANNLLVTDESSLGAFISWGAIGRNIRLVNNVMLGARKGSLRLDDADRDLRVERNVIDGITFNGTYPTDWRIQGNTFRSLGVFQDRYQSDVVTSSLPPEFTVAGTPPSDLAQFCRYISEPLDLVFGTRYDRNVGAEFSCS